MFWELIFVCLVLSTVHLMQHQREERETLCGRALHCAARSCERQRGQRRSDALSTSVRATRWQLSGIIGQGGTQVPQVSSLRNAFRKEGEARPCCMEWRGRTEREKAGGMERGGKERESKLRKEGNIRVKDGESEREREREKGSCWRHICP